MTQALDVGPLPAGLQLIGRPPRPSELEKEFTRLREAERRLPVAEWNERRLRLERLRAELHSRREDVVRAVASDFGRRSRHETLMAEVLVTLRAIDYMRSHLRGWVKPKRRRVSWMFPLGKAWVTYQPLGVVGIVSPWNYPVHLALAPLATALAAGNRVMLKPSELAPRTSELLAELVSAALDSDVATVVTGGSTVSAAFCELPFDHLFFTGSPRVARLVMRACADELTPLTLELGGKSPAIVGRSFALQRAATRIMTGKLFNAGQTCLAPDYALVPRELTRDFAAECGAAAREMYPELPSNDDYTAIVSDEHFRRLEGYIEDALAHGARVIQPCGAGHAQSAKQRVFMPALVLDARPEMRVLQEEIFGPILPVIAYDEIGDAIAFVRERAHPLALYYFGNDRAEMERVLAQTNSGGVTINDTCLHAAQDDLPFGGVGPSGFGRYHAFEGFAAFSNQRAVFRQGPIDTGTFVRAPFGRGLDYGLQLMLRS